MADLAETPVGHFGIRQQIGLFLGPAAFLIFIALPTPTGMSVEAQRAGALALLMAIWWICEAIPLAATSLVPLALYPFCSVLSFSDTASRYADPIIFLFMGGFFLAMAMQKWNLHKRIALYVIALMGGGFKRTLFGFMAATWFLSMWVSNTATTVMILPIALAVISQLDCGSSRQRVGLLLMLGVAYAANVGGMATLIGTAPNAIFAGQSESLFPELKQVGFVDWLLFGLPLSIGFLLMIWGYLAFWQSRGVTVNGSDRSLIQKKILELGAWTRAEKRVLVIAIVTALAWIWRADLELGTVTIPGWTTLLGVPWVQDGTIAIAASILLFAVPADFKRGEYLLDWDWAKRIPWDVLILLGGGFALAESLRVTGLANYIGEQMVALQGIPIPVLVLTLCLSVTFLTEITSNSATTTMILPILAAAAGPLQVHPFLLMIPVTLSASCAFMMPVATPPNAIVFGSGYITIPQMARTGFILSVIGAFWITFAMYFIIGPLLDLPLGTGQS